MSAALSSAKRDTRANHDVLKEVEKERVRHEHTSIVDCNFICMTLMSHYNIVEPTVTFPASNDKSQTGLI